MMKTRLKAIGAAAGIIGTVALGVLPAQAHHSFAMYEMDKTVVVTGVVTGVDPAPNHLSINFAVMNEERTNVIRDDDGQPIIWSVEMQGSAAMARQGVSVNSFPARTVFSVALHPLRNNEPGGSRDGAMFRCPDETPPAPGMHCDSVEGHTPIGTGPLPEASE